MVQYIAPSAREYAVLESHPPSRRNQRSTPTVRMALKPLGVGKTQAREWCFRALARSLGAHSSAHNTSMVEVFLLAVGEWASEQTEILAVGVVGSQARGAARPDSDVDFVMIVSDAGVFFASAEWINRFGHVCAFRDEDWGRLRSRRVHYTTAPEFRYVLQPGETISASNIPWSDRRCG